MPQVTPRLAHARYRFPMTRPELPGFDDWRPFYEEAERANWYTNFGDLSRRLEDALSKAWGFDETKCIATNNGTSALAACLIARGVEGRVLIPAFTFPAAFGAVKMAGAEPVLIDASPGDWTVSATSVARAFDTSGARAVVLLAPFGIRSDFSEHIEIARSHSAEVVIDNAAGLGLRRRNVEADVAVSEVYSFHATKVFGIGEGGMIFSNQANERAVRSALNFGLPDFEVDGGPRWGINGKLSEVHAAIGLAALKTLDERLSARQALAKRYIDVLDHNDRLRLALSPDASCWQIFPVLLPTAVSASKAIAEAASHGMEARNYYRPALSRLLRSQDCPYAEDLAERTVCFPIYSRLTDEEATSMTAVVEKSVKSALSAH